MYSPESTAAPLPIEDRAPAVLGVSDSRYIKLGEGGRWAADAIANGTIPFGYRKIAHLPCIMGDWEEVRQQLIASGRRAGKISDGVRELRAFYELDERTLWVTISSGHLWWTRAEQKVHWLENVGENQPVRMRRAIGGWQCTSLTGEPLKLLAMSTSLTKVARYQATICSIEREDYLLRRICGEPEPLVLEAMSVRDHQEIVASKMIAQLHWRQFEIMVDLIFARGGWQRQSALGEDEVDADLRLLNPTIRERAWVQVKSSADQKVLNDYVSRFQQAADAERFYFICHTAKRQMTLPYEPRLHVWTGQELARQAISAGLFDWLIDRTK